MRVCVMLAILALGGCGSDFWNQPATPAQTGVSSSSHSGDTRFGGGEPNFSAKGSQRTFGTGRSF